MAKSAAAAKKGKAKTESKKKQNGASKAKVVDLEKDDIADEDEEEDEKFVEKNGNHQNGDGKENKEPTSETHSHSLLADCEKHFGSKDLYSILNVDKKTASDSDIKKAYYKLSLKYHPDKGDETNVAENTAKFQTISKIYAILSDAERKKMYDEQGVVDDDSDLETRNWEEYWRNMFKKITKSDVDKFFAEYRDSAEERADLLRLYEKHQGDLNLILEEIFSADLVEDEPRFRAIIQDAIDKQEVQPLKKFVGESKAKAARRKATYEKEAREAAVEAVKMGIDESEESLKKAILGRRKAKNEDFLSKLEKKYANKNDSEDEEEEDDEDYGAAKPKKAKKTAAAAKNGRKPAAKKVKRL